MFDRSRFVEGLGAGAGLIVVLAGISLLARSLLIPVSFKPAAPRGVKPGARAAAPAAPAELSPADYLERCRAAGL